jgi:hypothetical protein
VNLSSTFHWWHNRKSEVMIRYQQGLTRTKCNFKIVGRLSFSYLHTSRCIGTRRQHRTLFFLRLYQ